MERTITFASGTVALVALAATALSILNRQGSQDGPPCGPVTLVTENFDSVTPPALPPGWSSITWATSNSGLPTPTADTFPNAAFSDDPAVVSDKQLLSPIIFLSQGGTPVQITFRSNFNLQEGFDGGVLEISIDGGNTFEDILTRGSFVTGGYTGTISNCCGNPLAGRQAWTGNSGGFISTTVALPIAWGPNMVLRWRMGSDNNVSGQGWRVETVVITQCHNLSHRRLSLGLRRHHAHCRPPRQALTVRPRLLRTSPESVTAHDAETRKYLDILDALRVKGGSLTGTRQ